MKRTVKNIALMALIAALAGCGGGDNSNFAGSGSGTSGGTSGSGTGGSTTGTVPQLGSGTPFVAGGITVSPSNIGSNTSATVSVAL
ncbi:MAG TPA: hypothetical protein VFK12_01475, partial [Gammaproteobacteria bacterium]|nr:hypothetical protein [Gammaproteobacteria bacterium]